MLKALQDSEHEITGYLLKLADGAILLMTIESAIDAI